MDALTLLQKNTDIVFGAAGGVLLGPTINRKLGETLNFGQYSGAIIPIGVAFLTLMVGGKARPDMAVAFAAVELSYGLAAIFPGIGIVI